MTIMHIRPLLLVISFSFSIISGFAQDTIDPTLDLIQNIHRINSIDPSDTSSDDLIFLGQELQNARMVMLGEQSHGDGSTFLAKTRMIKYLHEKMGYNVLVFESGLIDAFRVWAMITQGADSAEVFDYGIFPVWSGCEQVQPLFHYILEQSSTDNPLILAGFDMQPTGSLIDATARWNEVRTYLSDHTSFTELAYPRFSKAFSDLRSIMTERPDKDEFNRLEEEFKEVQNLLENSSATVEDRLYAHYVDNYFKTLKLFLHVDMRNQANTPHVFNIRDREMARNMEFLYKELYPEEKFIVWGANSHLGYGRGLLVSPSLEPLPGAAMVPMGQYLKIDLQDKLYTISFTSYSGTTGSLRGTISQLDKPSAQSLEHQISNAGFDFAFLSMKEGALLQKVFSTCIYGHEELTGKWAHMTDGIFFIKEMGPAIRK